jgi:hypothetical protein
MEAEAAMEASTMAPVEATAAMKAAAATLGVAEVGRDDKNG